MKPVVLKFSALLLSLSAGWLPVGALAQLSSPLPAGTGPGVHSPNSPFAPLPERADVLAWSLLSGVKTQLVKTRLLPQFPVPVQALNEKYSACRAS
jgi:hypothetical protein